MGSVRPGLGDLAKPVARVFGHGERRGVQGYLELGRKGKGGVGHLVAQPTLTHSTALHCTNPRAVSARERRHIIPSAPGLTPHSQKKASLPNLKSKTTIPFLYIEIACAAKKLSRLPAVSPPTRQSDMNPPAASASSSPTYSANPIMQLLPRYPLLTPKHNCTTTR